MLALHADGGGAVFHASCAVLPGVARQGGVGAKLAGVSSRYTQDPIGLSSIFGSSCQAPQMFDINEIVDAQILRRSEAMREITIA